VKGESVIERWQNKVRLFRRKAKGWSVNVEAEVRKKRLKLSSEYDKLDVIAENRPLSDQEKEKMHIIYNELNKIWGMEESKARQRAREREKRKIGIQSIFK
jgi:hypothetical protein